MTEVLPKVRAVIVGDGPLKGYLEELSRELAIEQNVTFVGHQNRVEHWLKKSKIFALTSESEGLSQAMVEAMLTGLPAVVPQVGDLAQLVVDGENGFLISRLCPQSFAERFQELLSDPGRLASFGIAARRSALRYDMHGAASQWDNILWGSNAG
jgi:glycosyltransferase involved in cell wall biosynthesis